MDTRELKSAFTFIYRTNYWGGLLSKSGRGSDPDQTIPFIPTLITLLHKLQIHSMVDLGCGDMCWMQNILPELEGYMGVDIVTDIVRVNRCRFGSKKVTFTEADVTQYQPNKVDAVFCRDVIGHLDYEHAFNLITHVKLSKSTWFITSTYQNPGRVNMAKPRGAMGWYPPKLTEPPFNFPQPEELLEEGYRQVGFEDKALGVWKVENLP